jgi:hypothetical protein
MSTTIKIQLDKGVDLIKLYLDGRISIMLGYMEGERCPYATWLVGSEWTVGGKGHCFAGHHFETFDGAQKDFDERIADAQSED